MLRYRADVRTLCFITAYFVAVGAVWVVRPTSPWVLAPVVAFLCALAWINAVITHNVIHSPVWRSRTLNRLTQFALSLTYGFAVSDYIPGHNLSHHRYTQSRRDVMRTSKVRYRWNLLNLAMFFFHVGFDVMAANGKYAAFAKERNRRWLRQRRAEVVLSWSVKGVFLLLDWKLFLATLLLPHLWAVWGITTVNLLQHDGCDEDHPYNHSRNFVGRVFNWFTFNNGFHGMHHLEPGLHWSLLPQAHAERLAPHMDARLDEPSLAKYLLRAYVFPGERLRYDGKPTVLPAEGPDQDWIGDGQLPDVTPVSSGRLAA